MARGASSSTWGGARLKRLLTRAMSLLPEREPGSLTTAAARIQSELRAEVDAQKLLLEELSRRLDAEAARYEELSTSLHTQLANLADVMREQSRMRLTLEAVITDISSAYNPTAERVVRDHSAPVVSVIMPTWNRAAIVSDAIGSVQAQTFAHWELLIIDDGSVDDTRETVTQFLQDQRIRYIHQENQGSSAARNRGLSEAKGLLIAYLDSDNLWYPGFLNSAVAAFALDPTLSSAYGILVSDSHHLSDTRLLWKPFDREKLLSANFIDMNVFLHRRDLVHRYGGFDLTLARVNDWDLILRLTEHSPARPLPILAAYYRDCDDHRLTRSLPACNEELKVRRKWYPPQQTRKPRVVYLVGNDPAVDLAQVSAEAMCMRRWGVEITFVSLQFDDANKVGSEELARVVTSERPHAIHVHGLRSAEPAVDYIGGLNLPMSVRAHACDTELAKVQHLLQSSSVRNIWVQPRHLPKLQLSDARLRTLAPVFDTAIIEPVKKNEWTTVLVAAGAAEPDDVLLGKLADALPHHRFIPLCPLPSVGLAETLKPEAHNLNGKRLDQIRSAAIYLGAFTWSCDRSTEVLAEQSTILQALATGAQIILPDVPEAAEYGSHTLTYDTPGHAAQIIGALQKRSQDDWRRVINRGIDFAFFNHADEITLRPLFEDWCSHVTG